MLIEAVVAVWAGIAAHSVLLTVFGFDSVIELISGAALARRLSLEAQGAASEAVEQMEGRTARLSAWLLVLLCVYIVASSGAGFVLGFRPGVSLLGFLISGIALIVMPLLAAAKAKVNETLDSPSLRADVAETLSCALLAATTLVGLGASVLPNLWWIQYAAALAMLVWLVPEAREAFDGWKSASRN